MRRSNLSDANTPEAKPGKAKASKTKPSSDGANGGDANPGETNLGEMGLPAVDEFLAGGGLKHGTRSGPGWARSRSPRGGGDRAPRNHAEGRSVPAATPGKIDVVRVPDWAEIDWLLHGFSTRTGGVSVAYLDGGTDEPNREAKGELNLGFTDSDEMELVAENRRRLVAALACGSAPVGRLATLRQVHSSLIHRVGKQAPESVLQGDGMMTDEPGVVLGVLTADCIPVLIADRKRRAVAALHAGWRGTLRRIVENGVGRMRAEFGSDPEDLVAAIGPGIGQCCYSVGEEVRTEFDSQFLYSSELFCEIYDSDPVREKYPLLFLTARAPGHSPIGPSLHLDLMEANRRQLLDAGLSPEAIYMVGECTSCRTDRFFSHRREHGFTGRLMAAIGVAKAGNTA